MALSKSHGESTIVDVHPVVRAAFNSIIIPLSLGFVAAWEFAVLDAYAQAFLFVIGLRWLGTLHLIYFGGAILIGYIAYGPIKTNLVAHITCCTGVGLAALAVRAIVNALLHRPLVDTSTVLVGMTFYIVAIICRDAVRRIDNNPNIPFEV